MMSAYVNPDYKKYNDLFDLLKVLIKNTGSLTNNRVTFAIVNCRKYLSVLVGVTLQPEQRVG